MKITSVAFKWGTLTAIAAIAWNALSVCAQDKRALCETNLKHLGLAMLMYMQDYDDKLPPSAKWCDALGIYTSVSVVNGRRVVSKEKNEPVLHCPAAGAEKYGYAMNKNLGNLQLARLTSPAETVLLYETMKLERNASGTGDNVAFRHDDVAVYLFVDGHIKWFGQDEKPKFDVPTAKKTSGIGKAAARKNRKK